MLAPFPCPHCQQPAISVLEKLCLGPALTVTCAGCEQRFSVPWRSMLFPLGPWLLLTILVVPLLGLVTRAGLPDVPGLLLPVEAAACLTVAGVGWVALALLWLYRVPLEKR